MPERSAHTRVYKTEPCAPYNICPYFWRQLRCRGADHGTGWNTWSSTYLWGRLLGFQGKVATRHCRVRHGLRKGHAMGANQNRAPRCSESWCLRHTSLHCFDCERPYCRVHLTCLRIPLLAGERCFLLCRRCRHVYADDVLLRRIVTMGAGHRDG